MSAISVQDGGVDRRPSDGKQPPARRWRKASSALLLFAIVAALLVLPAEARSEYHGSYVSCYSPYRPTAWSHSRQHTLHTHYHEGQGYDYQPGISFYTKNYRYRYGWTSIHTGTSMNGWLVGCRA